MFFSNKNKNNYYKILLYYNLDLDIIFLNIANNEMTKQIKIYLKIKL